MAFLELKDAKVHYPIRGGFFNTIVDCVQAVDGINIKIEEGQTYGLIGESGSGKSTVGKVVVGLETLTSGELLYKETNVNNRRARKASKYNKDIQMIFQDALSSLNPRKRILDIIAEPIRNFEKLDSKQEFKRILELLEIVGMPSDSMYKYPHEFSGGQKQRISIARAVACKPKLIVADEPVSALDLSVQAQVLNYMKQIQKEFKLSYLFISHDLGVVKYMCDYIYIMNNGRFVETGTRDDIYQNAQHIYTKKLIAAIPKIDPNSRTSSAKLRMDLEEENKSNFEKYFDNNNKAYDLQKITDSHFVALRGV